MTMMMMMMITWSLLACALSSTAALSVYVDLAPFTDVSHSGPFNHLVVDKSTGRVYVGAVNRLYQLTGDLDLEKSVSTGPHIDGPNCRPPEDCDYDKQETDSVNKGLVIDYRNNRLLACTNLYQGHCDKHVLHDIDTKDPPEWTAVVPSDPSSSVVMFIGPGYPEPGRTEVLYVAATRGRSTEAFTAFKDLVPAVCSRRVDNFDLVFNDNLQASKIDVEVQQRDSFFVDYVYGFGSEGFSYFLTVQRESVVGPDNNYVTRVLRVCQNDRMFSSYTELPLECHHNGTLYNLLQAATVAPVASDLALSLGISHLSPPDEVLFAVFSRSVDQSQEVVRDSVLCVYTMRSIRSLFTRTIKSCFQGLGNIGPAHFVVPYVCVSSSLDIDDNYCGEHDFNKPIAGTEPVLQTAVLHAPAVVLTAIAVTRTYNFTVALLGDDTGTLSKVVVESGQQAVVYERLTVASDSPIQRDMVLSPRHDYVYVMTRHNVTRVRLSECGQYVTCGQCLGARDPYCGWCSLHNKCSLSVDCPMAQSARRWLSYQSPQCPRIVDVLPRQVTLSGSGSRRLEVSVLYLPALVTDEYQCAFSGHGVRRLQPITDIRAGVNGSALSVVVCETPEYNLLPPRPTFQDHIVMGLSLRREDRDFVTTNFTFFDCGVHHTCSECTTSEFPCTWCVQRHVCTHNSEVCLTDVLITGQNVPGSSDRVGPGACPRIESTVSDIVVASGHHLEVTVQAVHLQDFQTRLWCLFNFMTRREPVRAELRGNTIHCQQTMFQYTGETKERNVPFQIEWGDERLPLDNPGKVQVKVYKCGVMGASCGDCLSVAPLYHCGWCRSNNTCLVQTDCDHSQWLDATQYCPNPVITQISPRSGPTAGGTMVTIVGENLGKSSSDVSEVSVAGVACVPDTAQYSPAGRIVCETGRSASAVSGVVRVEFTYDFVAESSTRFHFVTPVLRDVHPLLGPVSGGTSVTITGDHLDSGTVVKVSVNNQTCSITRSWVSQLVCITGSLPPLSSPTAGHVVVTLDQHTVTSESDLYRYMADPTITDLSPLNAIVSGGTEVTVRGTNLHVISRPQMQVYTPFTTLVTGCDVQSNTTMMCDTPNFSHLNLSGNVTGRGRRSAAVSDGGLASYTLGFIMDGVTDLTHLTNYHITVYSDPEFDSFEPGKNLAENLIINGRNLARVLTDQDIRVTVGGVPCNITSFTDKLLMCTPPRLTDSLEPYHKVMVFIDSSNLTFDIGQVHTDPAAKTGGGSHFEPSLITILAIAVPCAALFLIIPVLCFLYQRKSKESDQVMTRMQNQMDVLEARVAKECKEAFAELQTEMTDLTSDLGGMAGIPFRDYRSFCMRVLFPNVPENEHPITRQFECESDNMEKGLRLFNQLLANKIFLLIFIRTLESRRNFVARDKVNVASLVSAALQNRMEYHTDILKTLLAELIEKAMEGRSHPKLLLRRTESVADKMLSNWLTFLLARFLQECAGEPLFLLFRAVKQQVDKGPVDAQTSEARYSLSEDKLIRQQIDYKTMTIYVIDVNMKTGSPELPVRVLDCDSISQVKEKILDTIYKNHPYSTRPTKNELDLEWQTGDQGRLILSDEDRTSKYDGEFKRLNTLAHYRVPDGAVMALVTKQTIRYNANHASNRSLPRYDTYTSSSPSLSRSLSPHTIDIDARSKIYHLVKHHDSDGHREGERGNKMVSEVYLSRLLATKGTLQLYVDNLFETIFSTATRGSVLPLAIKYLFDFLDDQALHHTITDPEMVHTWKSNSLPLRFWVNVMKNPDFVFDEHKSNIVDSCLSVVAQTFMDSCSMSEHQLSKDSPSSKLLYARDIPKYKKWVERYYQDIKQMPAISDQDMNALLAEESRLHQNEFSLQAALYELYQYVHTYNQEIMEALEEDEFARSYRLASRLDQVHTLMGTSYA